MCQAFYNEILSRTPTGIICVFLLLLCRFQKPQTLSDYFSLVNGGKNLKIFIEFDPGSE